MKTSDPQQESAVLGYFGLLGVDFPDSELIPEGSFTDPRWRPFYAAARTVHAAGKLVNQFSINEEIERSGRARELQQEFPTGDWRMWMNHADSSLQHAGQRAVVDCLQSIHRYAQNREAIKVGQLLQERAIEPTEAEDRLRQIREGSRTAQFSSVLKSRRFDSANPPPAPRTIYERCAGTASARLATSP